MERADIALRVSTVSGNFRRGGFAFGVVATVLALSALTPVPAASILVEKKLQVEIGDGDHFVMLNTEQRETMAEIIAEVDDLDDLDLQAVLGAIMLDKTDEESPHDGQADGTADGSADDGDKTTDTNSQQSGAEPGAAGVGAADASAIAEAGAGAAQDGSSGVKTETAASATPAPSPAPSPTPTPKSTSAKKTAKKPATKSAS